MLQLAIASVPMQPFRGVYNPAEGWPRGTIFSELDLPFAAVPGGCALPRQTPPGCLLDAMQFALYELRLFLDTHPADEAARASYRHLAARIAEKLGQNPPCMQENGPWDWAAAPLPWQNEEE